MTTPETRYNCLSPLELGEVRVRLARLSKRGKLAGFRQIDDATLEAGVFGTLYDRVMTIDLAGAEGGGTRLTMTTRLKRTLPTVVIVVMALALWPGVLLTDSMLSTYFGWYPKAEWVTWAWYVPLMLLAIPVLWKQYRASEAAAAEHAHEVAQRISATVDGALEVIDAPPTDDAA